MSAVSFRLFYLSGWWRKDEPHAKSRWLVEFIGLVSSTAWALDEALPHYEKVSGISGSLLSVGSDTLAGMTTLWVEEFQAYYPAVNAQVQASGSATAPPALSESTAQFGPMSRPMRSSEIAAFEAMHGYKPTALRVAIDAVGILCIEIIRSKG